MVVFRTDEGTKLDAVFRGGRVAFEVDGADATARTGWSAVVRGKTLDVTDPAELARLRQPRLSAWAPGAKSRYVRILPAKLTGRRTAGEWLSALGSCWNGRVSGSARQPLVPSWSSSSTARPAAAVQPGRPCRDGRSESQC
jgi:hypothetical protein